ncbi:MAG: phosphoglycerate kinase [Candidatus Yanofskybacteria bacterium]|nr:phosphoglycerate kinase [Candidatus Yanofskybacteria bacterium]
MKSITDLQDLNGKNILLRVDFDVPVQEGKIGEPFRIEKQKETITYLLEHGAGMVMVAHIKDVDSFESILPEIQSILGQSIGFIKTLEDLPKASGKLLLLDNIRQYPEEEKNDPEFAKKLAAGFDYYVNNAFAVSHRNHASVAAIAQVLPAYAGFLIQQETQALQKAIDAPAEGKIVIMGGAKASTKVPVIKNFLFKAQAVLVGGVIANDVLSAQGKDIGASMVDHDAKELLVGVDLNNPKLIVPEDFVIEDGKYLDIGPQATEKFSQIISQAKFIIWNGPLGMFEEERFAQATKQVAQAIINSGAASVIGGGDTIAAINSMLDKFSFVSTGGGAMLAFLAGEKLSGLEALHYYG